MKNIAKIVLSIIILVVAIMAFNSTSSYTHDEEIERIESSIQELSLKCYSIEGRYPKNIDYLKENYGLLVNSDDYQIIYYYEGDNIQPQVTVFKKEINYE